MFYSVFCFLVNFNIIYKENNYYLVFLNIRWYIVFSIVLNCDIE